MDALPPPAPPAAEAAPAPIAYAATDIRPRQKREIELCEKASHADWLYLGGLVALDVASIYVHTQYAKFSDSQAFRLAGPSLVGLTWGATVSGIYLSLPKCAPEWAYGTPPEGNVRASWPAVLSLALLGGVTAPVVVWIETGPIPYDWNVRERSFNFILPAITGFAGALVPYLLPPKTWRAAKEIERIRLEATDTGAFVGYRVAF